MRRCLILLIVGAVVIASTIIYALVAGNFTAEAVTMFPLPWFQLSMVDLYLGFLLFGGWVLFREPSRTAAVVWIVLLLTLGNVTACVYAIRAIVRSGGDWTHFWLGDRMSGSAN
ncbi:MAG: hypothetical protein CMJ24_06945 [Phycisphaerae bacterium]|nr:hypothetical protein [Phycisphaerae bacterium]MDG1898576.1 DUF1475 family protein [Phycisphaerales bacterium]|tara:strand:+ start:1863 stop:2204 length:342 start_codon:yes stop_codon:yes gene_type:complete